MNMIPAWVDSTYGNAARETGDKHPLPMLGYGKTAGGVLVPILVAADGSQLSQAQDGATGSASVTSQTTLFTIGPLTQGAEIIVHVTSAGTGCTITYEGSIDGITWMGILASTRSSIGQGASTTSTSTGIRFFDRMPYFRARVSTYGSGTVTAIYQVSNSVARTDLVQVSGITAGSSVIANSPSATNTQNTLALSGASQQVLAANSSRKSWQIQNNSGVTIYVNVGAAASNSDGKSFQVPNGATIGENGSGSVSGQAINVLGASGSIAYSEGV